MTFRVLQCHSVDNACSPFRVTDDKGREIAWISRFLDRQKLRGVAVSSLRSYAHDLLHFLRWWVGVHHSVTVTEGALTGPALLDYIRFQTNQQPPAAPASINRRVGVVLRALRLEFPQAELPRVPDFQYPYWRPFPISAARPRPASSRLRVRVPKRVIVPVTVDDVARFWASFRTSRDLAIVGLMILDGLRSCQIVALNRDDVLFSDSQLRVRGKGGKLRWLPLPSETARLLDHYLRSERPANAGAPLFVSLKGKARGRRLTFAGLRSLFRYHRLITTIRRANPHRFRHTFATDMVRAGMSLPALMQLMGHSRIETTLIYVQLAPQDVYEQYARAIANRIRPVNS
jgi:integrase